MSDCSQHKKEVAGISDMKVLAEMIGDLHYESLAELFYQLSMKIYDDGMKDFHKGRTQIASELYQAATEIANVSFHIKAAWQISKPFMEDKIRKPQ